eukprot:XP_001698363.1 predicted protein [Chlamydomonas reinhardtii]
MLAACPTLQRLRLQLGPLVDSGLVVRPPPSLYRPLPAAASAAAALLRSIAGLTHLHSLELAGSCWPPLWAELDAPATGLGLASSLLPITALSHLTRLVLGLSADAQDSRRWHVRYGGCCRQLFGPQPGPQPGAQPQHGPEHSASELGPVEGSMFERLLDLDLGMDLALTLPCIPYGATALTRLCVGELTAEWASEAQWDILPEPPPPLPADMYDMYGGGMAPPGAAMPRVRLPPNLRVLKASEDRDTVRFMPDAAILAALAALPSFRELDVWALGHPQGELCLDLACVGRPGPPQLAPPQGRAAAPAAAATAVVGAGGIAVAAAAATGREPAGLSAAARRLGDTVAAAAGLLLRVLRPDDWKRHPLTLRPSTFSFTRWRYDRLQWEGPHGD